MLHQNFIKFTESHKNTNKPHIKILKPLDISYTGQMSTSRQERQLSLHRRCSQQGWTVFSSIMDIPFTVRQDKKYFKLRRLITHMHAHKHTHTHTHTYTYAHIHTHTYTYAHTLIITCWVNANDV